MSAGASSWLASRGVKAVGADNMAGDEVGVVDPDLKVTLPGIEMQHGSLRGLHLVVANINKARRWLVHYKTERSNLGYRNMGKRLIDTINAYLPVTEEAL